MDSFNSAVLNLFKSTSVSTERWFGTQSVRLFSQKQPNPRHFTTKKAHLAMCFFVVERGGFEPPKSLTTDLQSAPFGHSGTSPLELVIGIEPTTY